MNPRPPDDATDDAPDDATDDAMNSGMPGYRNTSYGDAFADVYDDWYADVSDVAATVTDLARLAQDPEQPNNHPMVLELGVGTGRLAIPLAAALPSARVVGIDTSEVMLAQLARNDPGRTVEALVADMIDGLVGSDEVLPDTEFDLVFVAYNTLFNLTQDGAQSACFRNVAARLRPGGRFVVEAFVPVEPSGERARDAGRDSAEVTVKSLSVDRVVLSVSRHDFDQRSAHGQFIEFTEAGGVRLRPWAIRYSSPAELDAMAAEAGLELEARWEAFGRIPFDPDSPRHVSVYRSSAHPPERQTDPE